MTIYHYEALSAEGKKISGVLDAETLNEAKRKLLTQSIFLTQIRPLSKSESRASLNKGEVINFTKELSRLLKAGLPLYESLDAMEEKYRGQKAQKLLLDLCEQVRSGKDFSKSLERHRKTFDLLYVAMIANAEKTGSLADALDELGVLLGKQQEIRKQLINALLYPTLLFGFCFFVLGSLLFYVIPSLRELFEGRDLPPFTYFVFAVSRFACEYKGTLAVMGGVAIGGAIGIQLIPNWRRKVFAHLIQLPLLKELYSKVALIRFCRSAATLLEGSVPIVSALAQARSTMLHPVLEQMIQQGELAIAQGMPLHATFLNHPLVPPLVPRMLGIAEESGDLPSMLRQIAEIYEGDIERALTRFSTIAQPALLLLLGAIVGLVLLSVLLPLTDVSSFAAT
jgi:general secretion pathway protein F/type IV pilus assembly protein PilC